MSFAVILFLLASTGAAHAQQALGRKQACAKTRASGERAKEQPERSNDRADIDNGDVTDPPAD